MSTMLDHITLGATDIKEAKKFYDAILGTLGYHCVTQEDTKENNPVALGYGQDKPFFWIRTPLDKEQNIKPSNGTQIAFKAFSQAQVVDFYQAALKNGGKDDGAPGIRPEYSKNYYAAFVRDPIGHKIEIVCTEQEIEPSIHQSETEEQKEKGNELFIALTASRKKSEFMLGLLLLLEWAISFMFYSFFVFNTHDVSAAFSSGDITLHENPLNDYILKSIPLVFLAATLLYFEKKNYSQAHLAAFAPIIVPLTAWGFLGITDFISWAVFTLAL